MPWRFDEIVYDNPKLDQHMGVMCINSIQWSRFSYIVRQDMAKFATRDQTSRQKVTDQSQHVTRTHSIDCRTGRADNKAAGHAAVDGFMPRTNRFCPPGAGDLFDRQVLLYGFKTDWLTMLPNVIRRCDKNQLF